jgi:transposase
VESKGEVCFEEEVEKMRRSGMSTQEISQRMGVDPVWVESLISMWEPDGEPSAKAAKPEEAGA